MKIGKNWQKIVTICNLVFLLPIIRRKLLRAIHVTEVGEFHFNWLQTWHWDVRGWGSSSALASSLAFNARHVKTTESTNSSFYILLISHLKPSHADCNWLKLWRDHRWFFHRHYRRRGWCASHVLYVPVCILRVCRQSPFSPALTQRMPLEIVSLTQLLLHQMTSSVVAMLWVFQIWLTAYWQ